jgi:hypothetical protein
MTSNIAKNLAPSTKSAETLSLAKNWIADCTANHQRCNIVIGEKPRYPTRLLNFGLVDDSHTCCRLVETSTTVLDGPYMTLSHCWGLADCLKLTTDNYDQLLSGITLSLLPQLYQDAFYIARCLNIKNLWIDSLCIIQLGDDFADWRREVTLMSDIYLNSFCNISSVDAPDGHHSMFCSRNPDALHPEVVSLFLDGHISPYLISDSRFWDTDVSSALLNTRAWVLQERLLSPRILHFGAQQMLWECREKDAAEIYPDGLPPAVFSSLTRFKNLTPGHYVKKDKTDINIAAYNIWVKIVQAYTACSLTFPSDKIAALSAIAKMMRTTLCDEYVAGMWRHYLERELLWSADKNRSGNPPGPQTYRAPSWSWMAVDGKINPGLPNVEASDMLMKVDGLQLEYLTDDNTGSIHGGWLRLRGMLKQLMLMPHRTSTRRSFEDWNMVVNGVHVSCPSDSAMREPQPHVMLDAFHEDFDKQNAEAALYCMPGRARKGDNGSIYVLLLVLDDREKAIFRRIGLAHGWGEDVKEKILARSGEEDKFPCEEYRDGLHLIRII